MVLAAYATPGVPKHPAVVTLGPYLPEVFEIEGHTSKKRRRHCHRDRQKKKTDVHGTRASRMERC